MYEFDPKLYLYLIRYPPEIIITFDEIVTDIFYNNILSLEEKENWFHPIRVRLVDLKEKNRIRDLTHKNLNSLISIQGIFLWLSKVIPEPREMFFYCTVCWHSVVVPVEWKKVLEPSKCDKCENRYTF